MSICPASFSGASLSFEEYTSPQPTSGDLLCQLLEADGSPLCGGPIGAFPDMGVPRVRLQREDHGHCSEGIWLLLGEARNPWGLVILPVVATGVLAQSSWCSLPESSYKTCPLSPQALLHTFLVALDCSFHLRWPFS